MIGAGLANGNREEAPPEDRGYALELDGVSKSYGAAPALRDLSLRLPRGALFGLVGPSGSGKTTVLRLLATLDVPDAGRVRLLGIDALQEPATVRDKVGYMPASFGSYGPLTVREYLDFYTAGQGVDGVLRRHLCDALLELVDLQELQHEAVDSLRIGSKQRLSLARCLIHDPDVLLLDEPTRGAESVDQQELRVIFRELATLGKSIIAAFEDLVGAAETCAELGIMQQGELVAIGPSSIFRAPRQPGRRLEVRLLAQKDLEAAARFLADTPECSEVEMRGDRSLCAEFVGEEGDLSALLARMAAAGVSLTSFSVAKDEGDRPEVDG